MSVTMLPTSRPQTAFLNEKLLASHDSTPTPPVGGVGSAVWLAVVLLALVALAGLAVFALLPVVLLGVALLLPALLPLLLVLGGLLGDSAEVTAVTSAPTAG
jgi:hypothetical protein